MTEGNIDEKAREDTNSDLEEATKLVHEALSALSARELVDYLLVGFTQRYGHILPADDDSRRSVVYEHLRTKPESFVTEAEGYIKLMDPQEKSKMPPDYSVYANCSARELAFFSLYGSLNNPEIGNIGDIRKIRQRVEEFVITRPKKFQDDYRNEIRSEIASQLEIKAMNEGTEGDN